MKIVRIGALTIAVGAAVALLGACGDDEPSGDGATATATEGQAGPDDSPPPGDTFFLEIAAENTQYDVSELGPAPAGEDLTVQFDNDDPDIQHNWSLYRDEEGTDIVFEGEILTGVDTIDYAVPAIEEPGTYHYHCDIHPTQMTGELIVE